MADTPQRSDFNVETHTTRDMTQPADSRPAADDLIAEQVRRACAELEQICAGLSGSERDELRARIDSIQTQLTSGVSPALLLATAVPAARSEAQGYQHAEATRTQAALYEGIALSAAAQARVNYRMDALARGDAADYYASIFNVNPALKDEVRNVLKNEPSIQQAVDRNGRLPEHVNQNVEKKIGADEDRLDLAIANAQDPEVKQQLELIKKLQLTLDATDAALIFKAIESNDPDALSAAAEKVFARRVDALNDFIKDKPAHLQALNRKEFWNAEGKLDAAKLLTYYADHKEEIEASAIVASNKMKSGQPITAEEAKSLTFYRAMTAVNANHAYTARDGHVLIELAKKDPEKFAEIFKSDLPMEQRAEQLAQALSDMGVNGTHRQLLDDAQHYVQKVDKNPELRQHILEGDYKSAELQFEQIRLQYKLKTIDYESADIDQIMSIAKHSPEFAFELSLMHAKDDPETKQSYKRFIDNVRTNGGVGNQQTLSIMSYYNLDKTIEGLTLQTNIYYGSLSPEQAYTEVKALQRDALTRMEPYNGMVAGNIKPEYEQRLRNIPGIMNADGSLNIEALFEKARQNKDALGPLTAEDYQRMGARSFESLSDADKDIRAVAQTAAKFKATDLIRNLGARITYAIESGEKLSPEFQDEMKMHEAMVNTYGVTPEAEQREKIDAFLKRETYYANNDTLRADLVDFVVAVSKDPKAHEMLTNMNHLKNSDGKLKPGDPGYEAPQSEQNPNASATQAANTLQKPLDAREREGSSGGFDDLHKTELEKAIIGAVQGLSPETRRQMLGGLEAIQHIEAQTKDNTDFISYNEIEKALKKAGVKDAAELDRDNDGRVSIEEIAARLAQSGASRAQVASTEPQAATTPATAGSEPQAPALGR